jgi:hypothetical protein
MNRGYMEGPVAWELGEGVATSNRYVPTCYNVLHRASELVGSVNTVMKLRFP